MKEKICTEGTREQFFSQTTKNAVELKGYILFQNLHTGEMEVGFKEEYFITIRVMHPSCLSSISSSVQQIL